MRSHRRREKNGTRSPLLRPNYLEFTALSSSWYGRLIEPPPPARSFSSSPYYGTIWAFLGVLSTSNCPIRVGGETRAAMGALALCFWTAVFLSGGPHQSTEELPKDTRQVATIERGIPFFG